MNSISVIIPNYNRASVVGATIQNMLNQTLPPKEIIVVDDGSIDNSVEVIRSFGSRVCLIEQANQGPGAARNRGLEVASGEFIQFMDSDDLSSLNKLEVQMAVLQQTRADFAYSPWVRTAIKGKQLCFRSPVLQGEALPVEKTMLEWQLGNWCAIFQSFLFRRSVLDAAGRYRTDMKIAEDGEYLVRILLTGAQPAFTDECLVFYRTDGEDQLTENARTRKSQAEDLTKYFELIGEALVDNFSTMHPSTLREAALQLYRHNQYCHQQGWRMVPKTNPLVRLVDNYPTALLRWFDACDRLGRKLSRTSEKIPTCKGLKLRLPSQQDYNFAQQIGFTAS
ncbi:MAG: glycosyltransferase [Cyanobacteria bacterium P01_A01_bin.116]